jgi:hypothetical protein
MRYALVTPLTVGVNSNPGWHLITAGIRYWLRREDPEATFTNVGMLEDDPAGWEVAQKEADKIVFCGNPRFNGTEAKVWHDWGIWDRILRTGKPFIDAWAGSACAFSDYTDPHKMAQHLLTVGKNRAVLEHEAKAERIIARDKTTELLCKTVNPNTTLLPCSTYYARLEYGIEPGEKNRDAIVLRCMPGHEWIIGRARALQRQLDNCPIIVHCHQDWKWAMTASPICMSDPAELLRFYSHVKTLHSFRLHASIPALSLGAKVVDYAIDSRADALRPFGLTSVPFMNFGMS